MSFPFPLPPPPPPSLLNVVGSDSSPPRPSSQFKNLSPSILIITIILSVTVIASVALCLLLRHINRRCLRHLSRSSTTRTVTATPIFSSRRISPELPASSIIDSLPVFTFSSITRRSNSSTIAGDCAVCLSKFERDDLLRLLPLCCHAFHVECIDTWLHSNLTCPLCRSMIIASESDLMKAIQSTSSDSFRLEIGNVSRRGTVPDSGGDIAHNRSRSYSIGSFDYLVEEDSEVALNHAHHRSASDNKEEAVVALDSQAINESALAADVATGRSWLKEYVDRLSSSFSSRTFSIRSSGSIFTGSSRRTEFPGVGEWEVEETNRVGEEISEMFRWISGV